MSCRSTPNRRTDVEYGSGSRATEVHARSGGRSIRQRIDNRTSASHNTPPYGSPAHQRGCAPRGSRCSRAASKPSVWNHTPLPLACRTARVGAPRANGGRRASAHCIERLTTVAAGASGRALQMGDQVPRPRGEASCICNSLQRRTPSGRGMFLRQWHSLQSETEIDHRHRLPPGT